MSLGFFNEFRSFSSQIFADYSRVKHEEVDTGTDQVDRLHACVAEVESSIAALQSGKDKAGVVAKGVEIAQKARAYREASESVINSLEESLSKYGYSPPPASVVAAPAASTRSDEDADSGEVKMETTSPTLVRDVTSTSDAGKVATTPSMPSSGTPSASFTPSATPSTSDSAVKSAHQSGTPREPAPIGESAPSTVGTAEEPAMSSPIVLNRDEDDGIHTPTMDGIVFSDATRAIMAQGSVRKRPAPKSPTEPRSLRRRGVARTPRHNLDDSIGSSPRTPVLRSTAATPAASIMASRRGRVNSDSPQLVSPPVPRMLATTFTPHTPARSTAFNDSETPDSVMFTPVATPRGRSSSGRIRPLSQADLDTVPSFLRNKFGVPFLNERVIDMNGVFRSKGGAGAVVSEDELCEAIGGGADSKMVMMILIELKRVQAVGNDMYKLPEV